MSENMLKLAKSHSIIAGTLLTFAVARITHAIEQVPDTTPEATPISNDGGHVTHTSQCESRTINYITHSLPQSCLTSSWASTLNTASATNATVDRTPFMIATEPTTLAQDTTGRNTDPWAVAADLSTIAINRSLGSAEAEASTQPFMSFEDWKEMMIRKTGQDPQELRRRRVPDIQVDDRQRSQVYPVNDGFGDEDEVSLDFGEYARKLDAQNIQEEITQGHEQYDGISSEVGQLAVHRSKDAGKTCKERFSFASFDAGATILKTSSGAKNAKAILVENKDTYMLLECATPNKYVIIELTDDIWVDTIVLANFEFFSSMIRHFRVSVSDRYPVKMEKWKELGTFEARNSRDIQAFLVENSQIWAKYLRLEFLTHYSNEYYCPVSLVRVHGSRMLDKWKDSETGADEYTTSEIEAGAEPDIPRAFDYYANASGLDRKDTGLQNFNSVCVPVNPMIFQLPMTCSLADFTASNNESIDAKEGGSTIQIGEDEEELVEMSGRHFSTATLGKQEIVNLASATTDIHTADPSVANSHSERADGNALPTDAKYSGSEAAPSSSSASSAAGRSATASTPISRSRSNGTNPATPPPPTMQEGFFNSVTKRLQQVETNLTLSLRYVEEQSKHVLDTFQRTEQKQLLKISTVLTDLNQTVLAELRIFRDQYDQIWQSTILALESQKDQSQRDILALSARLHVLADEVVFQKRMAIVQAILLLSCLLLVMFSRGMPIPYLGSLSEQGMGTSAAFAEILASMQRRDMYPPSSPRYPVDMQTPTTPRSNTASPTYQDQISSSQVNIDEYDHQGLPNPLTPNSELSSPISQWPSSCHSSPITATGYEAINHQLSFRKPLPALPEDAASSTGQS